MKHSISFTDDMIEEFQQRDNIKTWKAIELISEYLGIECDVMNTSLENLGIIKAYVDIVDYIINFETEND